MSDEWKIVEHSWAETSIMDGDSQVCLLSIEGEATEENQDELEKRTARRAALIASAPKARAAAIRECIKIVEDLDGKGGGYAEYPSGWDGAIGRVSLELGELLESERPQQSAQQSDPAGLVRIAVDAAAQWLMSDDSAYEQSPEDAHRVAREMLRVANEAYTGIRLITAKSQGNS